MQYEYEYNNSKSCLQPSQILAVTAMLYYLAIINGEAMFKQLFIQMSQD